MNLSTLLTAVAGVGYYFHSRLNKLGVKTAEDLINYYPFRYDDFSKEAGLESVAIGEKTTVTGQIWSIKNVYTRSGKILTKALLNNGDSTIELIWFNSRWLIKQIPPGSIIQVAGKITEYHNKVTIMAPAWERVTGETIPKQTLHTGRLVPVYPETEGLSSKWIRTKIDQLLPKLANKIEDPLPDFIKKDMLSLPDAIQKIHFPASYKDAQDARKRLSFDELFFIALTTLKTKNEWGKKPAIEKFHPPAGGQISNFLNNLPFQLTGAQQRVIAEITDDLQKGYPMNRLVQGEVGSGKTIVAAAISYTAFLNGYRTLYMAPTEILAFQHFSTFQKLLENYGVAVGLYTGSRKFNKHDSRFKIHDLTDKNHKSSIINHKSAPDIIIGTHALLSDKLATENVGLVIVDEQQRFGVEQRSLLRSKARIPHFLTMTATPIPRTVALTLYGDLDLSIIDELPKGRQRVKTHLVPGHKRADAYKFVEKKVKEGDQVYIITPLIEFSETLASAKAATVEFERLKKEIFPNLKLGLLHGRMKTKEKEEAINTFKDKKTDILVSTSVVEVGVDVPNATIMVIEGAERFGLSQLHQLRGRVGRGEKESFCLLFPSFEDSSVGARLKSLETVHDGLKLAELDLKIRGAGEIFGTKQSGRLELKIASFSDSELIEKTREAAKKILEENPSLDKYPALGRKLDSLNAGVMPD